MDISSVGRCSALVVVPVLSLSGASCAFLPTAYFSTHTGGFGSVHRLDMTGDMEAALAHFLRLNLRFDAVYIGYTASIRQLLVLEAALPNLLLPGGQLFIDPVMGDHGRRYSFCDEDLIAGFHRLCKKADVIFPNRTEAALLLGLPLCEGTEPEPPSDEALRSLGARHVVLSGVYSTDGQIGVRLVGQTEPSHPVFRPKHPGSYPGTGDLLASCVISALIKGAKVPVACELACDFLDHALIATRGYENEPRFGLAFEQALPALSQALSQIDSTKKG